jgi:hypothetical protein
MEPFQERLERLRIDDATSIEDANERLLEAGLSDGLPVVPPTPERIAAFLANRRVKPEMRLSAQLMPASAAPSLWEIGATAVMAGCRREYLPVIVAALLAMTDPAYNMLGVETTTGSAAPVVIVHGPIGGELGINAAGNCMGQGNRANATIGRAIRLVLQNVGGSVPGVNDMATLGQPGKFGWCFAENQAASPLAPFHAEAAALPPESNAVTVMPAIGSQEVVLSGDDLHADALRLGRALQPRRRNGQALVVLPPEVAQAGAALEWDRRRWQQEVFAAQHAGSGVEGSPDNILIVVAGGVGIKAATVPGWGTSRAVTRAVRAL